MARFIKTTMYMKLPDGVPESEIDNAIADTLYEFGGQLIESTEYQDDDLYAEEDITNDVPKDYTFLIKEVLEKKVTIKGADREESFNNLQKQYHDGNIILSADDFIGRTEVMDLDDYGYPDSEWYNMD